MASLTRAEIESRVVSLTAFVLKHGDEDGTLAALIGFWLDLGLGL